MKKRKRRLIIIIALLLFIIFSCIGFILAFSPKYDWKEFCRFETDDEKYSVIVQSSHPTLDYEVMDIKVICYNKITGIEVVIWQRRCSFNEKINSEYFEFKCINDNEAELIINDFISPKSYQFIWSEIFQN